MVGGNDLLMNIEAPDQLVVPQPTKECVSGRTGRWEWLVWDES